MTLDKAHTARSQAAPESPEDALRWARVDAREAAADGQFVYGVATTGIYCRPSCPARRPRRENAVFFDDAAAAERAGYRPCKRCKPETADPQLAMIVAAVRAIEQAEEIPPLAELAQRVGLSPSHLHRRFKRATGMTPAAYGRAHREKRLRETLSGHDSVTAAMFDAGFGSASRFYARSEEALGMSPANYRKGGEGVRIRYGFAQSPLGLLLAAQSERGVCAILFGESREGLREDLLARFPKAECAEAEDDFDAVLAEVLRLVEAPGAGFSLPLDIRGTAFQQRVWDALRKIPPGRTASYGEIAAMIGAPKAVRAVGSACGANPLSVAVPCHRALRSDGSLGGYAWGLARKQALLERERTEKEREADKA